MQSNRFINWAFVAAQFALIIACCWGITSHLLDTESWVVWRMAIAACLIADSIALGIWALVSMGSNTFSVLPQPVADGTLCERGPYRWIAHPMYTAVILLCLAMVIIDSSIYRWVAFVLLTTVLIAKLLFEESLLVKRFSGYAAYRETRHRLIPGVW